MGTEETKVPNDHQGFPHIFMLQDLEIPSAEAISKFNLLLECDGPPPFGHVQPEAAEACDFANVLWVTSMVFNTNQKAKATRRRAYFITDNDNPTGSSSAARQRAITRGR